MHICIYKREKFKLCRLRLCVCVVGCGCECCGYIVVGVQVVVVVYTWEDGVTLASRSTFLLKYRNQDSRDCHGNAEEVEEVAK